MSDPERTAHQFTDSLQRWVGIVGTFSGDPNHLTHDISAWVRNAFHPSVPKGRMLKAKRHEEWSQSVHLLRCYLNAHLVQEFDRICSYVDTIEQIADSMESPLELSLLLALVICARENSISAVVIWDQENGTLGIRNLSCGEDHQVKLEIRPQSKIGIYRVDFLLSFLGTDTRQVKSKKGPAKIEVQHISIDKKVVVECDGHQFHEKTKEQARRDKERDRRLQSLGFPVYRYTGSEIFADVFRCASEIIRVFAKKDLLNEV